MPKGFLKIVDKAYSACDKLLKDGIKLSKDKGLEDNMSIMKEAYATLSKHLRNLDHVKEREELPGETTLNKENLDAFLATIAKDVQKYNKEIESAKGILKAMKNWCSP